MYYLEVRLFLIYYLYYLVVNCFLFVIIIIWGCLTPRLTNWLLSNHITLWLRKTLQTYIFIWWYYLLLEVLGTSYHNNRCCNSININGYWSGSGSLIFLNGTNKIIRNSNVTFNPPHTNQFEPIANSPRTFSVSWVL